MADSSEILFTTLRNTAKYRNWIDTELAPRQLSITDTVKDQMLENAIRYFNTHSAFKCYGMYNYTAGQPRIQLSPAFKSVTTVFPNRDSAWIWNGHPYWSLVGVTVLDNFIADSILMSEAFKNYRVYVGAEFAYKFMRNSDSSIGGYLYVQNVPVSATALLVEGTKRITKEEDIDDEYINDWLLRYYKALVKQAEGHTLRAASIIGVTNDGQQLYDEGKEEMKALQDQLYKDGRWSAFGSRA